MNSVKIRRHVVAALAAVSAVASLGLATPTSANAASASGPDTCIAGYVWRSGRSGDHVCVTPAVQSATTADNAAATSRREPRGGPYGPDTCKQGYVWREAWTGDHVCVTPAMRTQARNDNAAAASRRDPNWDTWYIDANTQYAQDIQEDHWFSDGDEFYVATIAFRSTPGKVGSTSAWFLGGLQDIDDIDRHETHAIPDAMGRAAFTKVAPRSFGDVAAGRNPEIIGTISVVFESDSTPFSTINSMMRSMAGTAQTEIGRFVEPLNLASLADTKALAAKLAATTKRIKDEATPTVLQKIGLFLGSAGDPDDLIGSKVSLFVAVDPTLAGIIDQQLGAAMPAKAGVAGALRPRTYTQNFAGDGASYDISFSVG